jgi:hypothetical protein
VQLLEPFLVAALQRVVSRFRRIVDGDFWLMAVEEEERRGPNGPMEGGVVGEGQVLDALVPARVQLLSLLEDEGGQHGPEDAEEPLHLAIGLGMPGDYHPTSNAEIVQHTRLELGFEGGAIIRDKAYRGPILGKEVVG